ncbi:cellulose synthase-like protein G1 isoform X1 [Ziziphus jujuba]|uniref:Cellulose synthase-like protein G1 isoform X1 n=1 Tax=Ziziphus jujuba TaxID=326968 RepID=A0ABM3I3F9_ZIZJJ|nr:cellulose synthase-like protein G1 isoform X1 [Ziziphus jujuba]
MEASHAPTLHTANVSRRTTMNRVFAVVYAMAIMALLYRHALTLHLHSTTVSSFFIYLCLLISDLVLAFMWTMLQSIRMRPVYRKEFPENIKKLVRESEFPALDVFICTADPYKEPPMRVVNTALSVMAYDYPTEKVSLYVSDDGGSAPTLFALMEAAKFASHWLPFCRKNNVAERCPDAYFAANHFSSSSDSETHKIKILYESMKVKVENVVERGKVGEEYIVHERDLQAFSKWNTPEFTRHEHPTVIQVILDSSRDKDITGHVMPNLIYVSREKSRTSSHHFKAGALNVLIGMRYGSLVEDYFTGYRLQCEGWNSIFCNPERAAFYGDAPISLVDVLNQHKRWAIGLHEVALSKYCPVTYGTQAMGPPMGFAYGYYAFSSTLLIPITVYAFLPQLALFNGITIFPKVSDPWFLLYAFLFVGAYGQDLLDFLVHGGTVQRWWNDQRMWLIRGLSCFWFGSTEYFLKSLGIYTHGFNVTSKVLDDEQRKRYEQEVFEFGVQSPMFVPLTVAAFANFGAFFGGILGVFRGSNDLEELLVQIFIAGFGMLNSWPVYHGLLMRGDKGGVPIKITLISMVLAFFVTLAFSFFCEFSLS